MLFSENLSALSSFQACKSTDFDIYRFVKVVFFNYVSENSTSIQERRQQEVYCRFLPYMTQDTVSCCTRCHLMLFKMPSYAAQDAILCCSRCHLVQRMIKTCTGKGASFPLRCRDLQVEVYADKMFFSVPDSHKKPK